jgi:hypothetical protein
MASGPWKGRINRSKTWPHPNSAAAPQTQLANGAPSRQGPNAGVTPATLSQAGPRAPIASSRSSTSSDSSSSAAARFSRRCSSDQVPGISRMLGERWSSQASATCIGVAPISAAIADNGLQRREADSARHRLAQHRDRLLAVPRRPEHAGPSELHRAIAHAPQFAVEPVGPCLADVGPCAFLLLRNGICASSGRAITRYARNGLGSRADGRGQSLSWMTIFPWEPLGAGLAWIVNGLPSLDLPVTASPASAASTPCLRNWST